MAEKNITVIMTEKRDIKLKHKQNLVNIEFSNFSNVDSFWWSTSLTQNEYDSVQVIIEDWLSKHMSTLQYQQSREDKVKTISLVKILYDWYKNWMNNHEASWIDCAMWWMIKKRLQNDRWNEWNKQHTEVEKTENNKIMNTEEKDTVLNSVCLKKSRNEQLFIFLITILPQSASIIMKSEVYQIYIRQLNAFSTFITLSVISMTDMLSVNLNVIDNLIFTKLSYKMWRKLLKNDLQYTATDFIEFRFDKEHIRIITDRHFCAAIFQIKNSELSAADFDVISTSSAHKLKYSIWSRCSSNFSFLKFHCWYTS